MSPKTRYYVPLGPRQNKLHKTMKKLPRKLTKANIDAAITAYKNLLDEIPLTIEADNLLELMTKIKRDKIGAGPWSKVSIFEASNRIMSDLVILYGLKSILEGKHVHLTQFTEFEVEFGNESKNAHDIISHGENTILIGEAFNVAPSLFNAKKNRSIKKLQNSDLKATTRIILCNMDAHKSTPVLSDDTIEIIKVDIAL